MNTKLNINAIEDGSITRDKLSSDISDILKNDIEITWDNVTDYAEAGGLTSISNNDWLNYTVDNKWTTVNWFIVRDNVKHTAIVIEDYDNEMMQILYFTRNEIENTGGPLGNAVMKFSGFRLPIAWSSTGKKAVYKISNGGSLESREFVFGESTSKNAYLIAAARMSNINTIDCKWVYTDNNYAITNVDAIYNANDMSLVYVDGKGVNKQIKFNTNGTFTQNNLSITAADLGLSAALKYCGITTTALSDGATTNPIVIDGKNHTASAGCTVFYGNKEYVYNGSKWNELGFATDLSNYATKNELAKVATTGNYNDLANKPTIPSAVTATTVENWGFTKNTDTITEVKMNGTSKGTNGVVDLGNVLTDDRLYTTLTPSGKQIPVNADLNTIEYLKVGKYFCPANTTAQTLKNCPLECAFMMEVYSPLSKVVDDEESGVWVVRLRKITRYDSGITYYQYVGSDATPGNFKYTNPWRMSPVLDVAIDTTDTNGNSAAKGSTNQPIYIDLNGSIRICDSYPTSLPANGGHATTADSATTATNAASAKMLIPESPRLASANISATNSGLQKFLSTGYLTTGYPGKDGHIIHSSWDGAEWSAQLFMAANKTVGVNDRMKYRYQNNGAWTDWHTIAFIDSKVASATSADTATKATQDGSGNTITSTYATKSSLTKVATSGDYNDLINKPTIPTIPSSLPASDVYAWAKAASKPTYTKSEIGLGNVDNTADANKSVKHAVSADSATTATNLAWAPSLSVSTDSKAIKVTAGGKTSSEFTVPFATKATYASCDSEGLGIKDTYAKKADLNGKADKSTTLAGYGITNAYTKTEVDDKELMPKLRLYENTYYGDPNNGLISINAEPNTVSYIVYDGEAIDIKLSGDTSGQPYTFIIDVNANFWGQEMIIKTSNGTPASVIWANGNIPYSDIETDYPDEAIEIQLIKYGNYWFGTWVAYR